MGAMYSAPTPDGGSFTSPAITGNIEASVLPPAVGAKTTAFFPSRMASPASSCTARSEVNPNSWAIACCSRSGKREKTLMASHAHRGASEAVVGRRLVELAPGHDCFFFGCERRGLEAEQLVGVLLRVIGQQVQDVDEGTQKLTRH